jgi:hypothetical protein
MFDKVADYNIKAEDLAKKFYTTVNNSRNLSPSVGKFSVSSIDRKVMTKLSINESKQYL